MEFAWNIWRWASFLQNTPDKLIEYILLNGWRNEYIETHTFTHCSISCVASIASTIERSREIRTSSLGSTVVLVIGAFVYISTICCICQFISSIARTVVATQYVRAHLITQADVGYTFVQVCMSEILVSIKYYWNIEIHIVMVDWLKIEKLTWHNWSVKVYLRGGEEKWPTIG